MITIIIILTLQESRRSVQLNTSFRSNRSTGEQLWNITNRSLSSILSPLHNHCHFHHYNHKTMDCIKHVIIICISIIFKVLTNQEHAMKEYLRRQQVNNNNNSNNNNNGTILATVLWPTSLQQRHHQQMQVEAEKHIRQYSPGPVRRAEVP